MSATDDTAPTTAQTDDLYHAFLRDRTRLIVVFALLLAIVGGTLGTGWALTAVDRDAERAQSLTWQGRYIQLYDEFRVETGEAPNAPEPGEVAKEGPQGEPGQPGPPGPMGPAGKNASEAMVRQAVAECFLSGFCVAPTGPAGPAGAAGEPGATGQQGVEGATGPAGPAGPAGTPGSAGVGIASIVCQEDGSWLFTLTDASTQLVPGPCRVVPTEPQPTKEPTP